MNENLFTFPGGTADASGDNPFDLSGFTELTGSNTQNPFADLLAGGEATEQPPAEGAGAVQADDSIPEEKDETDQNHETVEEDESHEISKSPAPQDPQPKSPPAPKSEEDHASDKPEEAEDNPLLAAMERQEEKTAPKVAEPIFAQLPVFSYNGSEAPIEDTEQTFDELRLSKLTDFPEFDEAQSLSWKVVYGKIVKEIVLPKKTKIGQIKREIETSKEFINALKKATDKHPKCLVKPSISMQKKGDASAYMDENIESIEKFIAHQFPDFVASLVAPLALVILLLAIDWRYGIVSLFGIILAFVVQFLGFNGSAKEKMHHYQTAQEDMNNASVEYVRGMPEIKAFNQTADSFRRLSKSITDYTSFVLEYAMGWQNCMPGFTTIIHNIYLLLIPVGIFIGMGAEDYRTYSLTFIFYLVLAPAISGVLNKIMYISESFTQIDGNVERMEEVLSIPVLQNQDVGAREQGHSIEFDHVSFSYDTGTSVKALNDVSFIARQGEVTAIVGPSGGGKSTIANLISRFWDVTEGCIRIGGVDIRKIPQAELMRQVSFVFQDTFLFKQSILDNIRMGNPTASEAQVIEAAKAAQCHDFIEKLPDGYHTMIGASGIRLSGGERQRIAIARAIIKDAPIIVLDEATAFSDPENEYLIQKAFEKLIQNKTVIMIAHRLSTIRNADQILVMEHGQLIEQGTHDTLMERQGKYTQMWNSYMESISWKIRAGKGGAIE